MERVRGLGAVQVEGGPREGRGEVQYESTYVEVGVIQSQYGAHTRPQATRLARRQ